MNLLQGIQQLAESFRSQAREMHIQASTLKAKAEGLTKAAWDLEQVTDREVQRIKDTATEDNSTKDPE